MPVSRRYAVVSAIAEHLKTITPTNGYIYNLSNSVFIGRRNFGDTDSLPAVTILEVPDIQVPGNRPDSGDVQKGDWEFFVQGFIKSEDVKNPTLPAYNLMADVTKALSAIVDPQNNPRHGTTPNAIYMIDGKVMNFDMGGFHVRQSDEQAAIANFYLRIRTQVVEKLSNPYD